MIDSSIYIAVYYNLLLLIVFSFLCSSSQRFSLSHSLVNDKRCLFILFVLVFLHITFRPIDSRYFGDTETYKRTFDSLSFGWMSDSYSKDNGFYYFTYLLAKFCNVTTYFGAIALLYILPVVFAFKKEFRKNYFILFLVYATSFSFWAYGVNGLRNGVATSLLLFAFFNRGRYVLVLFLSLIAVFCFHKSVAITLCFFLVTKYVNKTNYYLAFWLLSIPSFFLFGNLISSFISSWDIFGDDNRLNSYFSPGDEYDITKFSSVGFRIDFILYSAIPVILGYIYIYKKKFREDFYLRLYNTYLATNACWILVISVAYSNRFAYLSWFLIPVIIVYPLLKECLFKKQRSIILMIVFFNFLFTYVYWLIK